MNIQFSANSTTVLLTALHYTSIRSYASTLLLCSNYASIIFQGLQTLQPEMKSRLQFCELQTQQLGLAVGCPTFAIPPQEYTRNDLRMSEIQNLPRGVYLLIPLAGALRAL